MGKLAATISPTSCPPSHAPPRPLGLAVRFFLSGRKLAAHADLIKLLWHQQWVCVVCSLCVKWLDDDNIKLAVLSQSGGHSAARTHRPTFGAAGNLFAALKMALHSLSIDACIIAGVRILCVFCVRVGCAQRQRKLQTKSCSKDLFRFSGVAPLRTESIGFRDAARSPRRFNCHCDSDSFFHSRSHCLPH